MSMRLIVQITVVVVLVVFFGAGFWHERRLVKLKADQAAAFSAALVRAHAPIIGPAEAPVTIVEFFDPSCESCRAFYPIVKQIIARFAGDVRLVLRYAAFHEGSDEVVRMLEAARSQNLFEPVLEALLKAQPNWAVHGNPNLQLAWQVALSAGLDTDRAKIDLTQPAIEQVLRQDAEDVQTLEVRGTPTFFVNGKPLSALGPRQLYDAVANEVQKLPGRQ